ncbi:hypothetical protein OWR29_26410 [Actinoplanes sp. Pm04-4]|uniref:Uncharacterized protein n=1 Tax=Paractinoplanes pyxinae TaxID=2997416 RepID=A0ABT4B4X9_9ACTN|nr:hypothetical protein [Actinoplanes pyxinae]MCY1141546.1 hypothetical protein [Actinoplanes pyxinae]
MAYPALHPNPYADTVPGAFAVGDMQSGSMKRVASAVGDGSLVISPVHSYLSDLSRPRSTVVPVRHRALVTRLHRPW